MTRPALPQHVREGLERAEYGALRLLLTGLFMAGARRKRGRATHQVGVGGRGELRVHDPLPLPAHEVWQPGRRFDLLLRHANLTNEDDLSADYRGAALELSDGGRHVVDILMNTGETTVWRHVAMFAERMLLALRGRLPEFYVRHPDALPRYWGGLRRAPASYASLAYYSKLSGRYGREHACRYRLLPRGYAGTDTGLPTQRDFDAGVDVTARWPEETRAKDLVRREFVDRITDRGLVYDLQIAVRPAVDDPRDPMFDPCQAWDPREVPWIDLAELRLDAMVEHAELERLRLSIGNAPPSLGVFPARSARDFTSVGDLRASLYPRAAAARAD